MHLIKTTTSKPVQKSRNDRGSSAHPSTFYDWFGKVARWWRRREYASLRRKARRHLFLVETLALGPKQRVVLLRCGKERFLVGTGSEGIQSIVRVAPERDGMAPTLKSPGEKQWG